MPLPALNRRYSLLALSLAITCPAAGQVTKPTGNAPADDSTRIYSYPEQMPVYAGGGLAALQADLRREFRAASAAAGCPAPNRLVYAELIVGPSGTIYGARSLSDLNATRATDRRGIVCTSALHRLPAACEEALVLAASRLPRLKPGTLNGRRVAVSYALPLIEPTRWQ